MEPQSGDEYLDAIYELESNDLLATTSALAEHLGVAKASVSEMLRKLADRGLIHHERYQRVTLTPSGRQRAAQLARRHRLWEVFLAQHLGMDWTTVFEEACRLEHATSDSVVEKLDAFLGHPQRCPHGHPIPTPDGQVPARTTVALAELKEGQQGEVAFIAYHRQDMLTYVSSLGLVPGATLVVENRAPFEGPLTIRVGETRQVIGRKVAWLINVRVFEEGTDIRS